MSVVNFIRRLTDAGLSYEDALLAAAIYEEDMAVRQPTKSAGAVRQARYLENKRQRASQNDARDTSDANDGVTSPETKVSPTPPSKTQTPEFTPPIVPPKGGEGDETDGLFGQPASPKARRKQARALRLAGDVEFAQLWNVATPLMRRRGKSQEVVYAAWEAAKARQLPALIVAALRRYVTEDEDVKRDMGQPGLQRWLADKAYDQWLATSDGVPGITDDRWRMMVEFFHEGTPWPPDLGPPPGQPGCRAPPAILAEFDQQFSHRSAA